MSQAQAPGPDPGAGRSAGQRAQIVQAVRALAGLGDDEGPDDAHLYAGVDAFAGAFDYWYGRVLREKSVPKYRSLVIARVNPFVRRIELDGLAAAATAERLVEDYNSRNFVTAGGWALEALAGAASLDVQKSAAEGIDLQRHDTTTGTYHLYVLKSGLVTRNSDIVKALKRNARQAEKLLRHGRDAMPAAPRSPPPPRGGPGRRTGPGRTNQGRTLPFAGAPRDRDRPRSTR